MPTFALRITRPYDELNLIIQYLHERSTELVVAEHGPETGTGPVVHCHFYINSRVGYDAIRDKLKATYSGGNADYSLKQKYINNGVKEDVNKGAIKYMLKGKLQPKFVAGVSDDEIENIRSQWVAPARSLVYASPADADGLDANVVVELPNRILSPVLKTQKQQCAEIKNRLENLSYECKCALCRIQRSSGQEVLPVRWQQELIHQNEAYMYKTIHEVLNDCGQTHYCDKTVSKMVYHIWYVGREFECTPKFISERLHLR